MIVARRKANVDARMIRRKESQGQDTETYVCRVQVVPVAGAPVEDRERMLSKISVCLKKNSAGEDKDILVRHTRSDILGKVLDTSELQIICCLASSTQQTRLFD